MSPSSADDAATGGFFSEISNRLTKKEHAEDPLPEFDAKAVRERWLKSQRERQLRGDRHNERVAPIAVQVRDKESGPTGRAEDIPARHEDTKPKITALEAMSFQHIFAGRNHVSSLSLRRLLEEESETDAAFKTEQAVEEEEDSLVFGYCLHCDKQTDGLVYCSAACSMAARALDEFPEEYLAAEKEKENDMQASPAPRQAPKMLFQSPVPKDNLPETPYFTPPTTTFSLFSTNPSTNPSLQESAPGSRWPGGLSANRNCGFASDLRRRPRRDGVVGVSREARMGMVGRVGTGPRQVPPGLVEAARAMRGGEGGVFMPMEQRRVVMRAMEREEGEVFRGVFDGVSIIGG